MPPPGAKYFVSMGVHHDNFDLWNSQHHRWNAAAMGPKRDIVGAWKAAARRRGLRFGVSEHLGASYNWWYPNHLYDQFWPKLGIGYDGADPHYRRSLSRQSRRAIPQHAGQLVHHAIPHYHQIWFKRIRDLVDNYQPDLLYSDGGLPFGEVGRSLVAASLQQQHRAQRQAGGGLQLQGFGLGRIPQGMGGAGRRARRAQGHQPAALADRHLERRLVLQRELQLQDRRRGHHHAGRHRQQERQPAAQRRAPCRRQPAAGIGAAACRTDGVDGGQCARRSTARGRGRSYGEGPTEAAAGMFKEKAAYTARDIRFTTKGDTLYAITLGEPTGNVAITVAGKRQSATSVDAVRRVRLLGHRGAMAFRQTGQALVIDAPATLPTRHASVFEITFA